MTRNPFGGNGYRNKEAIEFANDNGLEFSFTKKNHIRFRGPNGIVIASGTPRSPKNIKRIIAQIMKIK